MRLLTRTTSSDLYHDGDCSFREKLYAVIDIDKPLAKSILEKKELFQMVNSRTPEVLSLDFMDTTALYFSDIEDLACLFDEGEDLDVVVDRLEDCEVIVVKGDVELPEANESVCGDSLVIAERCFYWRCVPKYCSMSVETEAIMYEMMLEV